MPLNPQKALNDMEERRKSLFAVLDGEDDLGVVLSTTLADLLTPLLAADPFSTMRASLRR
jgi:hypothetical protein